MKPENQYLAVMAALTLLAFSAGVVSERHHEPSIRVYDCQSKPV